MENEQKRPPVRLKVAEIAASKNISTQMIADGAGVRYNTALSYMRNEATQVRLEVLDSIAYVLGVQPGELIERVPQDAPVAA